MEPVRSDRAGTKPAVRAAARVAGLAVISIALLAAFSCQWKPDTAALPARAGHGMVASAHPLASRVGAKILADGGNAVDAAVATAFALSVVEPYSSGLGGGGFMLIYPGSGAKVEVLDYREVAPAKATRDMYVSDGRLVPGLSTTGPLAAGVPGTVAGLCRALDRFGSMDLETVMAPAIALARDGFTVDRLYTERALITMEKLKKDECAASIFLNNGLPFRPGQRLVQFDLASTLEMIAKDGPEAFYRGGTARAIALDMEKKGGIITARDLADYKVRWRAPVRGIYRGYEIVSMPPPSSGGAVIIEILNMLEGYDLGAMGFGSVDTVHVLVEAMRLAFADRSAFMGDPAFFGVPINTLISKEYANNLRRHINMDRAGKSMEITPGNNIILIDQGPGRPAPTEGFNTTHLSVVDVNGGAVSLTQTINTPFGSGVVACGTGVLMNNEMDDFAAVPGQPNAYGLIQGEANAISPGKIPLSSMSPTMVFRDGGLYLVIGSPGGPRIITTVLQVIVNVVDFGMDVGDAIDAPRVHHQWLPDQVYMEPGRLSASGRLELMGKGHTVKNYVLPCNAQGVMVLPGGLEGASDPRGGGEPAGY